MVIEAGQLPPVGPGLTVSVLENAVRNLQGTPPAKWILMAPDGRMWANPDPVVLARICTLNSDFLPLLRDKLHEEYASGLDRPPR